MATEVVVVMAVGLMLMLTTGMGMVDLVKTMVKMERGMVKVVMVMVMTEMEWQ